MSAVTLPPVRLPPAAADRGPLSPWAGGRWDDGGLAVERLPHQVGRQEGATGPADLELRAESARVLLRHALPPDRIDNGLASWLAGGLLRERQVVGDDVLGRLVVGLVRSTHPDAMASWSLFYGNSLARLAAPKPRGGDDLDAFGRIYRQAARSLVGRRVLDVGSCLGFLPLQLAGRGDLEVAATDRDVGACRLLRAVAGHLGVPLEVAPGDATALPHASGSVDTVTAVHLLEHVDADTGDAILDELCRVAVHRVVIAVPYEPEPDARFGHVRTFAEADLTALGEARRGWRWRVGSGDGGWLILDRP